MNHSKFLYDLDLAVIPSDRAEVETDNGGCFGSGPGPVDESLGLLSIPTKSFIKEETEYEMMLELRKDTRSVTVKITVQIISAVPPIMEIGKKVREQTLAKYIIAVCADSLLCLIGEGGKIFINPSSRLAVKATCSLKGGSDCSNPFAYEWYVRPVGSMNETIASLANTDYAIGCTDDPSYDCNSDLALTTTFFSTFDSHQVYNVELQATNGQGGKGKINLFCAFNFILFHRNVPIELLCK